MSDFNDAVKALYGPLILNDSSKKASNNKRYSQFDIGDAMQGLVPEQYSGRPKTN